MDKIDVEVKISIPDIPSGLGEWVTESINQTIFESEIIHNIIKNLEAKGIVVDSVNKCCVVGFSDPTIEIHIDGGFCINIRHAILGREYKLEMDLRQYVIEDSETVEKGYIQRLYPIYTISANCKYGEPITILNEWNHMFLNEFPKSEKIKEIRSIIKETIKNIEYNTMNIY